MHVRFMRSAASVLMIGFAVWVLAPASTPAADAGRAARARVAAPRVPLSAVDRWTSPPVDVERLRREDVARDRVPGTPRRVGYPMKTALSPSDGGTWEDLSGGDRLWRVRIHSPDALWTVIGFETFRLRPGAVLHAYDPQGNIVLGPYTSADVRAHGQLWLPPVPGDTVVLELEWPAAVLDGDPRLRVGIVSHGYEAWGDLGADDATGSAAGAPAAAGTCNVDVNCPAGDEWQDEKRGVVQLLSGGYAFCSGSLINTTQGDCRPYVLTAAHCGAGPSTTFRFNYERPSCETGDAPALDFVTGATLVASSATSDFALLELDVEIPAEYQVHFNGWRRSFAGSPQSWGIHHPSGDVKKISRNDDPLTAGQYWGADHWRVADWELGTTEGGSSGSPLFDVDGRILGQLHGGIASCASPGWDEYGKLSASWIGGRTPATRLSDWLDPGGTGVTAIDGLDAAACLPAQPELAYAGLVLDDSAGNGNGALDPGETIEIQVWLANTGTLEATGVTGSIGTAAPLATILDDLAEWPDLVPDTQALSYGGSFRVRLDPSWSCGTPLELSLDLTAAESPGSWFTTFSVPTGQDNPLELFVEDVEGPLDDWIVSVVSGFNPWVPSQARSGSPTTSWFVGDLPEPSEAWLVMPTLTDLPSEARLGFVHFLDSEAGFDGGVLEYSTDGASWADAASLIVVGDYNGSIGYTQASSLAGRQAWTGDLGGWHDVELDLTPLSGQDVAFRWRFATDASTGDEGWYVDDVTVIAGTAECSPVALEPPGEASAATDSTPLTLAADETGTLLAWSAPADGGSVDDYVLYAVPLSAPWSQPTCVAWLGEGTSAGGVALPAGVGLLVVARNAAGEGGYGVRSDGVPRPAAESPCP